MSTQEKVDKINLWLRYHPNWNVEISLCDIYGCISVNVTKNGIREFYDIGENIDKRLEKVIKFLENKSQALGFPPGWR